MKLDALSLLVGAASLGVVLLTVSAFQVPVGSSPTTSLWSTVGLTIDGPVQIEGIPTPQQMMRVQEGAAFDVPEGKLFVVTGLGSYSAENDLRVAVRFGSQTVLAATISQASGAGGGPAVVSVPPGMVAGPEENVQATTLQGSGSFAVVLGYLADA